MVLTGNLLWSELDAKRTFLLIQKSCTINRGKKNDKEQLGGSVM